MKSFVVKTLVTGLFLLFPLFFLFYALSNLFKILRKIILPLAKKLDVESIVGVLALNVLVVIALLAVVFLLGLLAYLPAISSRVNKLDGLLADRVPGYSIFKGILGGAVQKDTSTNTLKSVIVRYNSTARIGFEVERSQNGGVTVFLPNVPNPQTGTAAVFQPEDVDSLDISPHKVLEMLSFFGRGVNEAVENARQQHGITTPLDSTDELQTVDTKTP